MACHFDHVSLGARDGRLEQIPHEIPTLDGNHRTRPTCCSFLCVSDSCLGDSKKSERGRSLYKLVERRRLEHYRRVLTRWPV